MSYTATKSPSQLVLWVILMSVRALSSMLWWKRRFAKWRRFRARQKFGSTSHSQSASSWLTVQVSCTIKASQRPTKFLRVLFGLKNFHRPSCIFRQSLTKWRRSTLRTSLASITGPILKTSSIKLLSKPANFLRVANLTRTTFVRLFFLIGNAGRFPISKNRPRLIEMCRRRRSNK